MQVELVRGEEVVAKLEKENRELIERWMQYKVSDHSRH